MDARGLVAFRFASGRPPAFKLTLSMLRVMKAPFKSSYTILDAKYLCCLRPFIKYGR